MNIFSWFKSPPPPQPPSRQFILITTMDTGRQIKSGVIEDLWIDSDWCYSAKDRATDRAMTLVKQGIWSGEVFLPPHRIISCEVKEVT